MAVWFNTAFVSPTPIKEEATLHTVMAKIVVEAFSDYFKDGTKYEVKKSLQSRWVIITHIANQWCLELRCECPKLKKRIMAGRTRGANLTIPPGKDRPDVMISCLFPESGVRLPLWIIDWNVNHAPSSQWGQAHAYGYQALRHNRSVLLNCDSVRTSIVNHDTHREGALVAATWNITVDDEEFRINTSRENYSPEEQLTFLGWLREVCRWCTFKAEWLVAHNKKPKAFHGVRWFPTVSFLEGKGYVNGEFQPNCSNRSSLFKCTKDGKRYWAKYLIKEYAKFEGLTKTQTQVYNFMRAELPKMHKKLGGMLPFRESFPCSDQVVLEVTRDIGKTNPQKNMKLSKAKLFVFRMLAMTQIDFKKLGLEEEFYWHADLRPQNVNAKGQVIDFEFLGFNGQRNSDNPELSEEQRNGGPTQFTAAWQIAILMVCLFAVGGRDKAQEIRDARRKNSSEHIPVDLAKLHADLRGDVRRLITKLSCLDVYNVERAYGISAVLKAQYGIFKKYVDGWEKPEDEIAADAKEDAEEAEAAARAAATKAEEEEEEEEAKEEEEEAEAKEEEAKPTGDDEAFTGKGEYQDDLIAEEEDDEEEEEGDDEGDEGDYEEDEKFPTEAAKAEKAENPPTKSPHPKAVKHKREDEGDSGNNIRKPPAKAPVPLSRRQLHRM